MAVESPALITAIAPQFLVDDVDRAIAYYRDKLGFSVDFTYQSFAQVGYLWTFDELATKADCVFIAEHIQQRTHAAERRIRS